MRKYSNFLHTEAYRRTFLSYLIIALLFTAAILGFLYQNSNKTVQQEFLREAVQTCEDLDRRAGELVSSIDQFYSQIYSSSSMADEFFRFFGATAEEYTSRRLTLGKEPEVNILTDFKNLVLTSNHSIRHVICYARENVVDLEFNDQGDSRHRIITTEEAEEICKTGCVYQKDIHMNSVYYGKMSFVLDLTRYIKPSTEAAEGRGLCLVLPDRVIRRGQVQLPEAQVDAAIKQGGFPKRITAGQAGSLYATSYTSLCLPFSVLYLTQARELLYSHIANLLLLAVGFLVAFGAISLVLIRRFSRDTQYISAILTSMEQAEKENFTPVAVTGYNPDYDAIVRGLNDLYAHLDSMIQREYKLTISQQKAQMDMLSTQLSPHFLYNTLERIRMRAVLENAPTVAEATAGLGRLYRNIVKTEPVIPLSRELEITREYLDLMSFLYGDQFMYYFDVDEQLENVQTPKIWMQPIVENFFKHNFQQDDKIKVVVVELKATQNGFEGRFFDNIGYVEPERIREINSQLQLDSIEGKGIGLNNVQHRLRLFYGSGLRITMENNDPAGICIHIIYEMDGVKDVPTADRG